MAKNLNITDINKQNGKFQEFYNKGVDQFIPKVKQNKINSNEKKWFNLCCVRARANKELL